MWFLIGCLGGAAFIAIEYLWNTNARRERIAKCKRELESERAALEGKQ